ncbi:MAG: nucleotidyltransferase family protein, partial [Oscillospiraceae bacterium]|nr:nucleotidyltransferase family protein [Oscillospiraceae bacterium]
KNIIMDAERKKILKCLEEEQVWYMPLKGALLKDWYPRLGMRQMSDNDILFDQQRREDVRRIMAAHGFTLKAEREVVDEYTKPPVSNFEMHCELFMEYQTGAMAAYYLGVKEKLLKDDGNQYGWHFTDEDFYLFMTAHEYKHFSLGGTGVRSLLDTYIFMRKYGSRLDEAYLSAELDKLGIAEYESESRSLAMKLFAGEAITEQESELLDYYVTSGVYGTREHDIQNRLQRKSGGSKGKYILRRLFPPMDEIKRNYPFFYRHKWLIPVLWVWRPVYGFLHRRKQITGELRYLMKNEQKPEE